MIITLVPAAVGNREDRNDHTDLPRHRGRGCSDCTGHFYATACVLIATADPAPTQTHRGPGDVHTIPGPFHFLNTTPTNPNSPMKQTPNIRLPVKQLRPKLVGLAKLISAKTTLPVLGYIRISLSKQADTIQLTATDLDTFLELKVSAEAPAQFDPFLVRLADLRAAVKDYTSTQSIGLRSEAGDQVTITTDSGETTTTDSIPASDFPELPTIRKRPVELDSHAKDGLLHAMACRSTDDTRYVLQGACLDGGDTFVGTDGHHLYRCNSMSLPVKKSSILAYTKVLDWKPLRESEDWKLRVGTEWYRISGDSWTLTGKLIQGTYPNWRQVLPPEKDFNSSATIPEATITPLIQTIEGLPGEKTKNQPIGLQLEPEGLSLLTRADEADAHTLTPVGDSEITGLPITVFVNREFLLKALTFGLNRIDVADEKAPVRIRQDHSHSREMIIMPLRVEARIPVPEKKPQSQPTPMKQQSTANPPSHTDPAPAQDNPLDAAASTISNVKGLLRQVGTGLTDLLATLKQAKTQQKVTQKEIRQVRSTIRTLQKVEL